MAIFVRKAFFELPPSGFSPTRRSYLYSAGLSLALSQLMCAEMRRTQGCLGPSIFSLSAGSHSLRLVVALTRP